MTAEDCEVRATQCARNAGLAVSEPVAQEFLKLAAQWRAMGSRLLFVGSIEANRTARAPVVLGR